MTAAEQLLYDTRDSDGRNTFYHMLPPYQFSLPGNGTLRNRLYVSTAAMAQNIGLSAAVQSHGGLLNVSRIIAPTAVMQDLRETRTIVMEILIDQGSGVEPVAIMTDVMMQICGASVGSGGLVVNESVQFGYRDLLIAESIRHAVPGSVAVEVTSRTLYALVLSDADLQSFGTMWPTGYAVYWDVSSNAVGSSDRLSLMYHDIVIEQMVVGNYRGTTIDGQLITPLKWIELRRALTPSETVRVATRDYNGFPVSGEQSGGRIAAAVATPVATPQRLITLPGDDHV